MRKMLILSIFLILALAITPIVLCAQAPPGPPWPEEEWYPMSPEEAQPDLTQVLILGKTANLGAGEGFYLFYRFAFLPTNEAYLLDGTPTTAEMNLQDQTDCANCRFTVTIDGEPLEPTSSFTGTGRWILDWWTRDRIYPRVIMHQYYIEFPEGLPAGTYSVRLHGDYCNPNTFDEPWFDKDTTLIIEYAPVNSPFFLFPAADTRFSR